MSEISEILKVNQNHQNTPNINFLAHLKHFGQKMPIFVYFWSILGPSKKIEVFGAKIRQFLAKISELLEIDKKHGNTQNVKFLGHLKYF